MLQVYKLKNGDDLMGEVTGQDDDFLYIEYPVTYTTLPNNGFQMKDWCLLVKETNVCVPKKEIMAQLGEPNEFGAQCYESFVQVRKEQRQYLEDEVTQMGESSFEEFDGDEPPKKRKLSKDVEEIFAALKPTDKTTFN